MTTLASHDDCVTAPGFGGAPERTTDGWSGHRRDSRREGLAVALAGVVAVVAVIGTLGAWKMMHALQYRLTPRPGEGRVVPALFAGKPAGPMLDFYAVESGKELFVTNCSTCHGVDGRGVKGLGKDLTISTFVAGLTDPEMIAFVNRGRDIGSPLNTTKVQMPPKGGNPALNDEKITDIVVYLRAMQDPRRMPATPPDEAATEVAESGAPAAAEAPGMSVEDIIRQAAAAEAAGEAPAAAPEEEEEEDPAEVVERGRGFFASMCTACHGADAKGLPGQGVDLVASRFVASGTTPELVSFLKHGRPAADKWNATNKDTPAVCDSPALNEQKIADIVAYLRGLGADVKK